MFMFVSAPRIASGIGLKEFLSLRGSDQGGKVLFLSVVSFVIAYLGLVPLLMLLYGSLRDTPPGVIGNFSFSKFQVAYSNPRIYESAWNTLVFGLSVTTFASVVGIFLAWITERT